MNDYYIIDDFLESKDFDRLKSVMGSCTFPWYFNTPVINYPQTYCETSEKYNFQFVHTFYKEYQPSSDLFYLMLPLIEKINPKSILRIKANLTTKTDEIVEHGYHIDFENASTCVFYLNTNNGYTKFKNENIISSTENRALFFDSNMQHTGSTCTDSFNRIVINLNYIGW